MTCDDPNCPCRTIQFTTTSLERDRPTMQVSSNIAEGFSARHLESLLAQRDVFIIDDLPD